LETANPGFQLVRLVGCGLNSQHNQKSGGVYQIVRCRPYLVMLLQSSLYAIVILSSVNLSVKRMRYDDLIYCYRLASEFSHVMSSRSGTSDPISTKILRKQLRCSCIWCRKIL